MTRENIEIKDFEDKKTTAGARYTRFHTDKGFMSCFDNKEAEKIKKYEGKKASVEIKTVGKFSNIEKVYGEEDTQTEDDEQVQVEKVEVKKDSSQTERTKQLNRVEALKIASVVYKEKSTEEIINLADRFYQYIAREEQ